MRPPGEISQASFEPAKWVGIVAMAIDHAGKIVVPAWYLPTHLVGRLAFPLFVWIIGYRLAMRPDAASGYIRWLLPWALVSQPAFVLAGRDWHDGNILFTLLFGVVLFRSVELHGWAPRSILLAGALAGAGLFLDYGPAGILAIPLLAAAARSGPASGLWTLALIGAVVNLPFSRSLDIVAALGAVPVAALSLYSRGGGLPRLPRAAFYAFYPVHLAALAVLAWALAP